MRVASKTAPEGPSARNLARMNRDPVFEALNGLVRSGDLTEDRAQTAYDAIHGNPPHPGNQPQQASGATLGRALGRAPGNAPGSGWERINVDAIVVTMGVGLLMTVLSVSVARSRDSGDLDWSVFSLGIAAALGLVGNAVASWRLVANPEQRLHLISWPGAAGAIGAGAMVGVAMDDGDLSGYVMGAVVLGLSAAGYWLVRSNPFVLTGIIGLVLLYWQVLDDTSGVGDLLDGDNPGIWIGLLLLIFGTLVTGIGWLLPTRVFSALVVGAWVLFGFVTLLIGLIVTQSFLAAFSGDPMASGDGAADDPTKLNNDAWMLLAFTALMIGGWTWCYLRTGHVGFRVLIVGALAMVPVLVTAVLAVEHPTWWEVVFGILGGGLLVALLGKATGRVGGSGSGPVGGMPMVPPPPGAPGQPDYATQPGSAPYAPAAPPSAAPSPAAPEPPDPTRPGGFRPPEQHGTDQPAVEPTRVAGRRRAEGPADPDQPSSSS